MKFMTSKLDKKFLKSKMKSSSTLRFIRQQFNLIMRQLQIARTEIFTTYPVINFNLQLFFEDALKWQYNLARQGSNISFGNYYEFGVYRGDTMITFHRALKSFLRTIRSGDINIKMFAFDSFKGLPKVENVFDKTSFWKEGQYSCSKEDFLRILKSRGINAKDVVCIPGYFEETLTPQLAAALSNEKPSIITIDCDLYTSTIIVLEWLRPLLRHGTLLYFDDIWSFCGHPDFGELRAIIEFNRKNEGLIVEHHLSLGTKRVWVCTNPSQNIKEQGNCDVTNPKEHIL